MMAGNGDDAPAVKQAIILAAGRGARFRPVTDSIPKPLVPVCDRPLIDWQLAFLADKGVERVVINCCYLADMLKSHVEQSRYYQEMEISFSTEEVALETGGGIQKALPYFGGELFYALNADVILYPADHINLSRLEAAFSAYPQLKLALLLQPKPGAVGIRSVGDFFCDEFGHIWRRGLQTEAPYFFTGVQLLHAGAFDGVEDTIFSMNVVYDKLIKHEPQHIAGIVNEHGIMLHVGDPDGHRQSEGWLSQEAELEATGDPVITRAV